MVLKLVQLEYPDAVVARVNKICLSYNSMLWKNYLSYESIQFHRIKILYENYMITIFSIQWNCMIGIFSIQRNCMIIIFSIRWNHMIKKFYGRILHKTQFLIEQNKQIKEAKTKS